MKLRNKIVAVTAGLAFLTIAAGDLRAGSTLVLTFKATALGQQGSTDNGTVTTTPAPLKHTADTKFLLEALALDENANGNYPDTTFPAGAKLVVVNGNDTGSFQVLDANNNLLVDVNDIITSSNGTNDIFSGVKNDATGLVTKATDSSLLTLKYGGVDEGLGGSGLVFSLSGLMTETTSDTAPKLGFYMESKSAKMTAGAGEGTFQGEPFVLTGSLTAAGKATLPYPPPQ